MLLLTLDTVTRIVASMPQSSKLHHTCWGALHHLLLLPPSHTPTLDTVTRRNSAHKYSPTAPATHYAGLRGNVTNNHLLMLTLSTINQRLLTYHSEHTLFYPRPSIPLFSQGASPDSVLARFFVHQHIASWAYSKHNIYFRQWIYIIYDHCCVQQCKLCEYLLFKFSLPAFSYCISETWKKWVGFKPSHRRFFAEHFRAFFKILFEVD